MILKDIEAIMNFYHLNIKIRKLYSCEDYFNELSFAIDKTPTIDAIPIEQVANFLMKFLDDPHPCNYVWFEEKMMDDEWCAYNCPIGENVKPDNECWVHAIKEGWLSDD